MASPLADGIKAITDKQRENLETIKAQVPPALGGLCDDISAMADSIDAQLAAD
jgi:hypothetical protein